MSYLHIENVYKNKDSLDTGHKIYALEKIHGTSAHVKYRDGRVTFFSGGSKHENFAVLFDPAEVIERTGDVVRAMILDVLREAKGEIVEGRGVERAIGSRTAKLFKARVCVVKRDEP